MTSSRRSVSVSVRLEVGSSMMMTRASSESALAISTICRCAIDRFSTRSPGPKSTPRRWSSGSNLARAAPSRRSRLQQTAAARLAADEHVGRDVEILEQVELLVDEGDAGLAGLLHRQRRVLARRRSRSTQTTARRTPPRIFISVDLPAPFSPIRPSTSPGASDEARRRRARRHLDRSWRWSEAREVYLDMEPHSLRAWSARFSAMPCR